jgi:hypothetical protein
VNLGDLASLDPATVPAERVRALLALVAAEQQRLAAMAQSLAVRLVEDEAQSGPDRLLNLEEAAAQLQVTPDWLRRQKAIPFRVEVSDAQVRYSANGLQRFIRAHTSIR